MEPTKTYKAKKYVITHEDGRPSNNVQIVGLPIKITSENVNDPNVLAAIANFEKRTGKSIFGRFVRLA